MCDNLPINKINDIIIAIKNFNYVAINIDIGKLEHSFVVVYIDEEYFVYDSYVGTKRGPRPYGAESQ
jgi:hypothetical protein